MPCAQRELLWKAALVGGILTTSCQTVVWPASLAHSLCWEISAPPHQTDTEPGPDKHQPGTPDALRPDARTVLSQANREAGISTEEIGRAHV